VSYETLADLARREETLVADGKWAELIQLQSEWEDTIATLPRTADAAELPQLKDALRRSRMIEMAIGNELARVGAQLAALRQGRRAVFAYGVEPDARLDARA
jgi:hypothetical protein